MFLGNWRVFTCFDLTHSVNVTGVSCGILWHYASCNYIALFYYKMSRTCIENVYNVYIQLVPSYKSRMHNKQ